jgi:putative transposase
LAWLFEARKRFGASILNYAVTSNHIHLIMNDTTGENVIPQTLQLVAGRTGQEYNQRKKRKGAFWEDRYHATAVEADSHLSRCMVYVDMNIVRAGVVAHPSEWPFCGYNEIQEPILRYSVIDYESLLELFDCTSMQEFKEMHRSWVEEAVEKRTCARRQSHWTESLAVGTAAFITNTKEKLKSQGRGRKVSYTDGCFSLKEPAAPYNDFTPENNVLRQDNTFYWNVFP